MWYWTWPSISFPHEKIWQTHGLVPISYIFHNLEEWQCNIWGVVAHINSIPAPHMDHIDPLIISSFGPYMSHINCFGKCGSYKLAIILWILEVLQLETLKHVSFCVHCRQLFDGKQACILGERVGLWTQNSSVMLLYLQKWRLHILAISVGSIRRGSIKNLGGYVHQKQRLSFSLWSLNSLVLLFQILV